MDRVKWAQNCLNSPIVIEDAYSQCFRPLELQIRTIPVGVGYNAISVQFRLQLPTGTELGNISTMYLCIRPKTCICWCFDLCLHLKEARMGKMCKRELCHWVGIKVDQ